MRKALIPLLLIIFVFVFWAFRPSSVSTLVKGQVLYSHQPISNVTVQSIEDGEDQERGIVYNHTNINGEFNLRFNARAGRPMYLKFAKEGYTTLVKEYVPHGEISDTTIKDIHLIKICPQYQNGLAQRINHSGDTPDQCNILIFPSKNLSSDNKHTVGLSKVDYFTHITKVDSPFDGEQPELTGDWYEVVFMTKESSKKPPQKVQAYLLKSGDE